MNRPYVNVDETLELERQSWAQLDSLKWYHGLVSRSEAESALDPQVEGCFLIRESSSNPGCVVVSAVFDTEYQHYQVFRESSCIFFFENGNSFIGLDTLLKYLQSTPHNGLPGQLTHFIPGKLPPFDYLAKTNETLLHQQCKAGCSKSVRAILCSKNLQKSSLNWRDESGSTPLHLAVQNKHPEICRMLVNSGALMENIDAAGFTPLQVACRVGAFGCVSALVQHGALVNNCHFVTKATAMHICADHNQLRCLEWLANNKGALFPIDVDGLTPYELALRANHTEILAFIENFEVKSIKFRENLFLHSELSRYQSFDILVDHGRQEGSFLVRKSRRCIGYVLSVIWTQKLLNYEIVNRQFKLRNKELMMVSIDDSPMFPSLEALVDHFSSGASSNGFKLTTPVAPLVREPLHIDSEKAQEAPSNVVLCHLNELLIGDVIGKGAYGEVKSAIWAKPGVSEQVAVAVKKIVSLQPDNKSCQLDFLSEIRALSGVNHPGIVRLLAVCFGPPVMLVTELVNGGSLLEHLVNSADSINLQQLISWSAQIARAMAYLESKKLIHRDLAARNILLKNSKMCKICDFGLSRMVGEGQYVYVATKGGKWPLRWYAPESINKWHFSSASDVWSYGVTLHEMFTYGEQPYGEISWQEVFSLIEQGHRLPQPPSACPDILYQIMLSCWEHRPDDRPSFHELTEIFLSDAFLQAFSLSSKCITNPLEYPSLPRNINSSSTGGESQNKQQQSTVQYVEPCLAREESRDASEHSQQCSSANSPAKLLPPQLKPSAVTKTV